MKNRIVVNFSKSFILFLFFFIGISASYSQAITYVSSTEAMSILSQEMTDIENKSLVQFTKQDDLMQDISKELMDRIDGGTTVENAINGVFQGYLDRVADINSTVEEINVAKVHTIDMLKVK